MRVGIAPTPLMNTFISAPFFILLFFILAASAVLGWFLMDTRKTVKKFLGETGIDLDENFARGLLHRIAHLEAKQEESDPRVATLERMATSSIQKIGFVRFNPFPDTGGDNSFMLLMLDHTNTGILLSSLYMRDGTRIYAKSIKQGFPRHVLSVDEQRLLQETLQS